MHNKYVNSWIWSFGFYGSDTSDWIQGGEVGNQKLSTNNIRICIALLSFLSLCYLSSLQNHHNYYPCVTDRGAKAGKLVACLKPRNEFMAFTQLLLYQLSATHKKNSNRRQRSSHILICKQIKPKHKLLNWCTLPLQSMVWGPIQRLLLLAGKGCNLRFSFSGNTIK